MEPIRSDRQQMMRRRKGAAGSHGGSITGEAAQSAAFSRRLEESESEPAVTEVSYGALAPVDAPTERLLDAVHEAGQKLVDERTYTAALQYRETVKRFLQRVLPEANTLVMQESGRDIMTRKRYYLITEINRSVDRLVQGLLQTQTRQLDILSRLEEIEGLLVDLIQ